MSDGCQNYDRGLGETKDREGWLEGPEGILEKVEVKYRDFFPKCEHKGLRDSGTCFDTFVEGATEYYCANCKKTIDLKIILGNYERMKEKTGELLHQIKANIVNPNLFAEVRYMSQENK
jgi:hypothetical protein